MRKLAVAVLVGLALASCAEPDRPLSDHEWSSTPEMTSLTTSTTTSTTSTTTSTTSTTTSTTSTTTSTTSTTVVPLPDPVDCIRSLPLALRIGQVLVPVVDAQALNTAEDLVGRGLVGGLVVVGSPDAGVVDDLASLQTLAAVAPLMIAVDEEGGTVQRLTDLLGVLPSARQLAELPIEAVLSLVAGRSAALAELGFTVNLAPVIDVGSGPGIGSRSFSDDPEVVSDYGNAFAGGVLAGGLTPVAKHFPGHGRANADSHDVLPSTPPLTELRSVDLVPWEAIPDGTAVMVGHLAVPGLTDGGPASLSADAITGLLRGELDFDGVVITDDLSMGAVAGETDVAEAARLALIAGADLLLVGPVAEIVTSAWGLVAAVDDQSLDVERLNQAVARGFVLRGVDPCEL